ncbi:MAG: DNA starvation/stationary phase protection protein [Bacteroidetes bacterium]|nr:DNA starvation/stationary phase protection protein [Bacteroidota bacterium]MBS1930692.1 DNA starvation/stationary phase protection protein [Bacteroidota bacterium]
MKANIGITDKNKEAVAIILNELLADEHILYIKTRNYHWNYEGSNFMELHKFYEEQYKVLEEMVDEIAERVRTLGHYAEGRMKDYLRLTHLQEQEYTTVQSEQLKNLLEDHENIIVNLRKVADKIDAVYKDAGTSEFVTGIMKQHEKMAWMIRSYLR